MLGRNLKKALVQVEVRNLQTKVFKLANRMNDINHTDEFSMNDLGKAISQLEEIGIRLKNFCSEWEVKS